MIVFGTETFLNLSGSMGNSLWKHSETGYDSAKGGNKMLQEISVKETNGHRRLDNFTNGEPNSVVTIAKELGPRFAARAITGATAKRTRCACAKSASIATPA